MELEDRRDNLRLLALVARGLGCTDLESYQPPSEQMTEDLHYPTEEKLAETDRRLEILKFIAQTGGG